MRSPLTLAFTLMVLLSLVVQAAYARLTVGYYPVKGSMLGWVEVKVIVCEDRDPSRPVNAAVTFHLTFKPSGTRVDTASIPVDEQGMPPRAFNLLDVEVDVLVERSMSVAERLTHPSELNWTPYP